MVVGRLTEGDPSGGVLGLLGLVRSGSVRSMAQGPEPSCLCRGPVKTC
jgi:hypothetical protein